MLVIIIEQHVHDPVLGYQLIHAEFFQFVHGGKIIDSPVFVAVIRFFNRVNLGQLPGGDLADKMIGIFDGGVKVVQSLPVHDRA